MELIFLGTGAGVPSNNRNVSSLVLDLKSLQRGLWMFDCGEGTQHQILKSPVKIPKLEKIFITHLHGDHIFGLPGLLCSRSMGGCEDPLTLFGPQGLAQYVETALTLSGSYLTFPLEIIEIDEEGVIYDDGQLKVSAYSLEHPVISYGYRIEEHDKPGALDAQRLKAEGVPGGPWMQTLKQGGEVTLDDGRVICGADYLGEPQRGRHLVIFGDTAPCENALKLAQNADVIVLEATLDGTMTEKANSRGHSSTVQTATLARDAGVGTLIATHFSGRYSEEDCERLLRGCQAIFPATVFAFDHMVYPV